MIPVELSLRSKAKEVPNVFFLVLFACSRDSYVLKSEDSKGSKNPAPSANLVAGRGIDGASSKIEIANFTFVFGSNPATGA